MKENKRFILDVNLTQNEVDRAVFEANLLSAKSTILTTESARLFQFLVNYPRLYWLLMLFPHFKEEKSRFKIYIQYVINKNINIKSQNFELAGKYRGLENDIVNTIITNNKLKSFNMTELVLKNGKMRLFIILFVR